MGRWKILLVDLLVCLFFSGCTDENKGKTSGNEPVDFYFGADLSYVNQILDHGGVYRDSGKISSPYKIFRDHGANLVRVRLWHDPAWTREVYGSEGIKVYSNLEEVEQTIRLSKEQGMQVELDFHYSDTWADPGKQESPGAWKSSKEASVIKDSIYRYTFNTLTYLNQNGITHYNLAPRNILLDAEVKGFLHLNSHLSSLPESFFFPL